MNFYKVFVLRWVRQVSVLQLNQHKRSMKQIISDSTQVFLFNIKPSLKRLQCVVYCKGLVINYGEGGGYKNLLIKRLILCGPPLIFLQNVHDPPPIWR